MMSLDHVRACRIDIPLLFCLISRLVSIVFFLFFSGESASYNNRRSHTCYLPDYRLVLAISEIFCVLLQFS
jgi:hypothetical protein